MKCYEIKKGYDPLSFGRAMMAIEGPKAQIEAAEEKIEEEAFKSTRCGEDSEKDGYFIIFFMVERSEVTAFRAAWKKAKAAV